MKKTQGEKKEWKWTPWGYIRYWFCRWPLLLLWCVLSIVLVRRGFFSKRWGKSLEKRVWDIFKIL